MDKVDPKISPWRLKRFTDDGIAVENIPYGFVCDHLWGEYKVRWDRCLRCSWVKRV